MNNIAIIRVSSVKFYAETIQGRIIYRGIDEFTDRISQRIRDRLIGAGVECSSIERSFKPGGSGFTAKSGACDYFIVTCVEDKFLPEAEVTIMADPGKGSARNWNLFEPAFRDSIESEFLEAVRWVSVDDFIGNRVW